MPFVAICEECEEVYPATVTEGGSLHLIGGRTACKCGSTEFRLRGEESPDDPEPPT